jgi:hypothetical protein
VYSAVFITEEVDEVGDKGSGDTTMVDLQTLLEVFLNMPVTLPFSLVKLVFPGKKAKLRSWDYSCQVLDHQDLGIIGLQLKGVLLYFSFSL